MQIQSFILFLDFCTDLVLDSPEGSLHYGKKTQLDGKDLSAQKQLNNLYHMKYLWKAKSTHGQLNILCNL